MNVKPDVWKAPIEDYLRSLSSALDRHWHNDDNALTSEDKFYEALVGHQSSSGAHKKSEKFVKVLKRLNLTFASNYHRLVEGEWSKNPKFDLIFNPDFRESRSNIVNRNRCQRHFSENAQRYFIGVPGLVTLIGAMLAFNTFHAWDTISPLLPGLKPTNRKLSFLVELIAKEEPNNLEKDLREFENINEIVSTKGASDILQAIEARKAVRKLSNYKAIGSSLLPKRLLNSYTKRNVGFTQLMLRRLDIYEGPANGMLGEEGSETRNSIKKFQNKFVERSRGLGKPDKATIDEISAAYRDLHVFQFYENLHRLSEDAAEEKNNWEKEFKKLISATQPHNKDIDHVLKKFELLRISLRKNR